MSPSTRRTFNCVFFGIVSACAPWGVGQSKVEPANALPDIVFVIGDDQGWTDYGFMGHEHIQTPNLNKLAVRGLTFTRGYVPDSLCRPSLASMISGLYPHQHGIVGNDPPPPKSATARARAYNDAEYQKSIEEYLRLHIDRMETLPDRLKPLGYRSFQTGKWWEGNFGRGGFDAGMTHGDLKRGARHGDTGLEIGRKTMEPIETFIENSVQAGTPYFLWYAPMLPHTPHDPASDLVDKYRPVAATESIAKYWAMCERFDQTVGHLMDIIERKGRMRNTLIVFTCDNGWINLPDKPAYAPKSKRSPYDGGLRTPIMISWPGKIEPRTEDRYLASTIDLVPTILRLIGLPADPKLPGIDLTDAKSVAGREQVFGEIFEHDIQSMDNPKESLLYRWVVRGDLKLIVPNPSRLPGVKSELYDLSSDPKEIHDLAGAQPEELERLKKVLDTWWN